MLGGTKKMKERSGAKEENIVEKQERTGRVKALADDHRLREKGRGAQGRAGASENEGDRCGREEAR